MRNGDNTDSQRKPRLDGSHAVKSLSSDVVDFATFVTRTTRVRKDIGVKKAICRLRGDELLWSTKIVTLPVDV